MKKKIIYLLLITSIFQINAQETIKEVALTETQTNNIKHLFTDYFNEIRKEPKDWNKIIDFAYPKLFTVMTKEDMINKLKKSFTNTMFTISFDKFKLKEIKQSFSFSDIVYTKVKYDSEMSFHFIKPENQDQEAFDNYLTFIKKSYKNLFKESKVTLKGQTITVLGEKSMMAIHDKNMKNPYYILELLKESESYYKLFLHNKVVEYITLNF